MKLKNPLPQLIKRRTEVLPTGAQFEREGTPNEYYYLGNADSGKILMFNNDYELTPAGYRLVSGLAGIFIGGLTYFAFIK